MKHCPIGLFVGWAVVVGSCSTATSQREAGVNQGELNRAEILRDPWHVPHVLAATDAGAMYGLGWACAEDRALQMYYTLRVLDGRTAEMLGDRKRSNANETTVHFDRRMRTFGWLPAAREAGGRLDDETRELLEAYSAGVNACIAERRAAGRLDPLFAELGIEPEPWTAAHCIASWWALAQYFSGDGTRELLAWRNLADAGGEPEIVRRAVRIVDDEAAVVRREDVSDQWLGRVREFLKNNGHGAGAEPPGGARGPKFSHAWAVGRGKSSTGSTILVSDPQTPVRNPSLWYEFHIRGKTFNARGIGVAGSPLIIVGFTPHVAWGATALGADQADLFRLKLDGSRPDEYQVDGQWLKMEKRAQVVRVKGGRDQELVIRTTRFGPVVTEFAFARPGDPPVALKRVPLSGGDAETVQGALAMMRARDVRGFHAATAGWRYPSVNLVFGDRAGAVGYTVAGAIPLRSADGDMSGNYSHDGSSQRFDWRGFVPHELLPQLIEPGRGWVASANHRPIASFYPAPLGLSTGSGGDTVRSWRLKEMLAVDARATPQGMRAMHHDGVNPGRREVVRLGLHLRDVLKAPMSAEATKALGILEEWFKAGAASDLDVPGAALAVRMELFFRIRATELAQQYGGGETGLSYFLKTTSRRLAENPKADLAPVERAFVDRVLTSAWLGAVRDLGEDPARWDEAARAAQRRQRIGYQDSLHGLGSLEPSRDLTPPGLRFTDVGTIACQTGQSYTQLVRLDDVDQSMSILPPGQSEDPSSPGWGSTVELWGTGMLHPAPLSDRAVRNLAKPSRELALP